MEPSGYLLTLAEVSIAAVGFAGVVSVLRGEPAPERAAMRVWRLRFMVTSATGALVFCLVPLPLLANGVPAPSVWALASGLMAGVNVAFVVWALGEQRQFLGSALYRDSAFNDLVLVSLKTGSTVLAVSNALGWPFASRFAFYLAGVLVWIFFALIAFFRMILATSRDHLDGGG